jgi:hypothetical protein
MSGVEVLYVGPRDVAATFGIVLGGIPQGEIMNAVQQEYFADVTVDFLSGSSGGERVLDLQIDDQIDNDGSIQILGKLLGASYQPVAAFANGLESSFREGQEAYVQRLIFDRLRPNAINEIGGIEIFEGISSVGGTVDVDTDAPARPQVDDGGGSSSLLIIAIVSVVGGIALILLVCWFCLSRRKSAEERREVKRYRERMKAEMRARRQDGKEILLGKCDNPEDTHNYREGIASTSDEGSDGQHAPSSVDDDRQSIVADDAEFADRSDKGQRSIPANSPPLTPREKPQLRLVKPLGDDLPGNSDRRAAPRPAKPDVEDSQKPEQPKLPTKKVSESHSVQYQPPTVLRGVTEDVPPGTPGSSLRKPQLRSVKSLGDDPPSSPRKRAALKPTKSMDGDELLSTNSLQKRVPPKPSKSMDSSEFPPGKRKGASPAALSRFMKAEPKKSANKLSGSRSVQLPASGPTSKKVKEAEDVPSEGPRKWPLFRGNTKSQDESNFEGELTQNTRAPPLGKINDGGDTPGTASGAPTSANLKSASPAELSKFMKEKPKLPTKKLSGSRSVQYKPPSALDATPKKFKEAEDVPSGSPRKRPPFGKTKSLD